MASAICSVQRMPERSIRSLIRFLHAPSTGRAVHPDDRDHVLRVRSEGSGHNTLWIPFLGRMRKRACKEQVKNRRQGVALATRDDAVRDSSCFHMAISDGKQLC
jgi:hypothetical protein